MLCHIFGDIIVRMCMFFNIYPLLEKNIFDKRKILELLYFYLTGILFLLLSHQYQLHMEMPLSDFVRELKVHFGNFGIGYSYQFSASGHTLDQRISTNTHEVGLRYRVGGVGLL